VTPVRSKASKKRRVLFVFNDMILLGKELKINNDTSSSSSSSSTGSGGGGGGGGGGRRRGGSVVQQQFKLLQKAQLKNIEIQDNPETSNYSICCSNPNRNFFGRSIFFIVFRGL